MNKQNTRTDQTDCPVEFEQFTALKPYIARCLQLNHELNNPLAGIIGYCDFLLETQADLPEDYKKYIKQILACAERMEKSIAGLTKAKDELRDKINLPSILDLHQK